MKLKNEMKMNLSIRYLLTPNGFLKVCFGLSLDFEAISDVKLTIVVWFVHVDRRVWVLNC